MRCGPSEVHAVRSHPVGAAVRCTLDEVHAHEVHANEMYIHGVHAQ
jgi:hypothetical protein